MGFKRLVGLATVCTFGLIMLGAYVRLSDAGLGCPDWPGCYGKLTPAHAHLEISQAVQAQGGVYGPVSAPKAWKEMLHRYVAGSLGVLIMITASVAWYRRRALQQSPALAIGLVAVVGLQGAFGAWTVTLLLKPAIVTGHLIGGMTLLGLLVCLYLRQTTGQTGWQHTPAHKADSPSGAHGYFVHSVAVLTLLMVCIQIVLGGWVSTNYAALACPDVPKCQGQWLPDMQFADAFHIVRELGKTAAGDILPMSALTAIHWTHRLGALMVTLLSLILGWQLWCVAGLKKLASLLWAVLIFQVLLGLSNVIFQLPLAVAVLHNGGAALLLVTLIVINDRLFAHGKH